MSEKSKPQPEDRGYKVIFMHGFSQDEMGRIVRGVPARPAKARVCVWADSSSGSAAPR